MPLERSEVVRAVIVRTCKELKRDNGMIIRYDDNAAVVIDQEGNPKGTRVFGAIARELRQFNFTKIVSLAPENFRWDGDCNSFYLSGYNDRPRGSTRKNRRRNFVLYMVILLIFEFNTKLLICEKEKRRGGLYSGLSNRVLPPLVDTSRGFYL
ncbi:hypothetical protein L1887_35466 [Cichorium endivia]|nr:hypothetical protein L1887_35466 [Cichorium endivia]